MSCQVGRMASILLCLSPIPALVASDMNWEARIQRVSQYYASHCARYYRVPVELVEAIMEVESEWNPQAQSCKGAVGLMQLMPVVLSKPILPGRVTVLDLFPGFVTAIRVPAGVSSIVVGDPQLFKTEHSEPEPDMVFVKPATFEPVETNLLITAINGQNISLLLRSRGEKGLPGPSQVVEPAQTVHFLMNYQVRNSFLIGDELAPSMLVPQTVSLPSNSEAVKEIAGPNSIGHPATLIETLLEQQKRSQLLPCVGKTLCGGIGKIYEKGRQVYVLFSLVNQSNETLEVLTPQVQLAARNHRKGFSAHSEQLPVEEYRLSRRRLGPKERADGVVVFQKPAFKQSQETYLLQIAEAGAADFPVLIPIPLGKSVWLDGGQNQ